MSTFPVASKVFQSALVASFLAAALLTGGASLEGDLQKAGLMAISGFILAALFLLSKGWMSGPVIVVLMFAALYSLIAIGQLIPLPIEAVQALPDRDPAIQGLEALGQRPEKMPLSLAPEATLISLLAIIAPLCGFCLIASVKWSRGAATLKPVIPLLCAASASLGLLQIVLGSQSGLYLYQFTNIGSPVGFFANANHQASFLLMGLPFTGVLINDLRRDWQGDDRDVAMAVAIGSVGLLILVGVLAAGSVAGYLMLAPVLVLSLLVAFTRTGTSKKAVLLPGLSFAALLLAAAVLIVFSSARLPTLGKTSLEDSPTQRAGINRTGVEMLEHHWASGTGIGSFEDVYKLYEDPQTVSNIYIAHAHNDYLEWLIEAGAAGAILLAAMLAWWTLRFARLWIGRSADALALRRAAAAASLVPVMHSIVDYPLRTPAVAVLAAMCLAVMVTPRNRNAQPAAENSDVASEQLRIVTL